MFQNCNENFLKYEFVLMQSYFFLRFKKLGIQIVAIEIESKSKMIHKSLFFFNSFELEKCIVT